MNLIGLKYPIKNIENNEEVGFKTIKNVADSQNSAGYMIFLTEDFKSGLHIGYVQALKLIERNKNNEFDNLVNLD